MFERYTPRHGGEIDKRVIAGRGLASVAVLSACGYGSVQLGTHVIAPIISEIRVDNARSDACDELQGVNVFDDHGEARIVVRKDCADDESEPKVIMTLGSTMIGKASELVDKEVIRGDLCRMEGGRIGMDKRRDFVRIPPKYQEDYIKVQDESSFGFYIDSGQVVGEEWLPWCKSTDTAPILAVDKPVNPRYNTL